LPIKFTRQCGIANKKKNSIIARPKKGCSSAFHGPPPDRLVRKNSDGWNKANPDAAAPKKASTSIQCKIRSSTV
jgi:hypothetical protein